MGKRAKQKLYGKTKGPVLEKNIKHLDIDCTCPLSVMASYSRLMWVLQEEWGQGRGVPKHSKRDILNLAKDIREYAKELREALRSGVSVDHAQREVTKVVTAALLVLATYQTSGIPPEKGVGELPYDPAPDAVEI